MKPNLFRSISNALEERFHLLPYIRQSFFGLLLFSILLILIGYTGNKKLVVAVQPMEGSSYSNKLVANYGVDSVLLKGKLEISNPVFLEEILLTDETFEIDLFTLILTAIISIIMIRLLPKMHNQNLFRKDISVSIRWLGWLLILHVMLSFFRLTVYAPREIEHLTHNQFTTHRTFPVLLCAELYTGLLIIAIGSAYKRGMKLQEEQDLTV